MAVCNVGDMTKKILFPIDIRPTQNARTGVRVVDDLPLLPVLFECLRCLPVKVYTVSAWPCCQTTSLPAHRPEKSV
jgi:hypothetical protein